MTSGVTLVHAGLLAGLPTAVVSLVLFVWAYRTGRVVPRDEAEQENPASQENSLPDTLGLDSPGFDEGRDKRHNKKQSNGFIMDKWFEFGGGYYGLMATLTFLHLEAQELWEMGGTLLQIRSVEGFISTLIAQAIDLLIDSLMNFINAFLWWRHWANELPIPDGAGFIWLGASYAGYLAGEWLAGFFRPKSSAG